MPIVTVRRWVWLMSCGAVKVTWSCASYDESHRALGSLLECPGVIERDLRVRSRERTWDLVIRSLGIWVWVEIWNKGDEFRDQRWERSEMVNKRPWESEKISQRQRSKMREISWEPSSALWVETRWEPSPTRGLELVVKAQEMISQRQRPNMRERN